MAKKVFTKEMILNTAFDLCKECGVDSLSMRMLAKKLNCSVMPIYDSFESKEDLIKELSVFCTNQTMLELESSNVLERYMKMVDYGLNFPQFFLDFVHIDPKIEQHEEVTTTLYKLMRRDDRLKNLTSEKLMSINTKIEIFIVGVIYFYKNSEISEEARTKIKEYVYNNAELIINGSV